MNVLLCCHRLYIYYSKYNLVARVSSKCNHTALLKDCVSIGVYEPSLFRHVLKVTLM